MAKRKIHKAFNYTFRAGLVNTLVTPVKIGLPSLISPFDENKAFQAFNIAIWDTGAQGTSINENVVKALGLSPHGYGKSQGVDGNIRDVRLFKIDIVLPSGLAIINLNVGEAPAKNCFDVLIGMDIIQSGDFNISNGTGQTNFSFSIPSFDNTINLVEKAEKVNVKNAKWNKKTRNKN